LHKYEHVADYDNEPETVAKQFQRFVLSFISVVATAEIKHFYFKFYFSFISVLFQM